MARALRRRLEERPAELQLPPVHGDAPVVGEDSPVLAETVNIHWGAFLDTMAVGGMTVTDVQCLLQRPHNIPPDTLTFVNGYRVGGEHRLAPGDTLEFRHEAGEKGSGHE